MYPDPVFYEANSDYTSWYLDTAKVPCEQFHNHLEIVVNYKRKSSDKTYETCNKWRKTYFVLSDMGMKFIFPKSTKREKHLKQGLFRSRNECNISQ